MDEAIEAGIPNIEQEVDTVSRVDAYVAKKASRLVTQQEVKDADTENGKKIQELNDFITNSPTFLDEESRDKIQKAADEFHEETDKLVNLYKVKEGTTIDIGHLREAVKGRIIQDVQMDVAVIRDAITGDDWGIAHRYNQLVEEKPKVRDRFLEYGKERYESTLREKAARIQELGSFELEGATGEKKSLMDLSEEYLDIGQIPPDTFVGNPLATQTSN